MVQSPRNFEVDRQPAFKAHDADGEVFHVVGAFGLLFETITAQALAFGAESRARYAGDGQRFRAAAQPPRDVEQVDADVDQRAATGERLGGEPAAVAGNVLFAQPAGVRIIDVAQVA